MQSSLKKFFLIFVLINWLIWIFNFLMNGFVIKEFVGPLSLTISALIWEYSFKFLSKKIATFLTIAGFAISVVLIAWGSQ